MFDLELKEFVLNQTGMLLNHINLETKFVLEKVTARELNNPGMLHIAYSFSEHGLRKPTKLQFDILANLDTSVIKVELIYLDMIYDSLTLEELNQMVICLQSIENQLNSMYKKGLSV